VYLKKNDLFSQWFKELKIVIAGKGPDQERLNKLAIEMGIEDSVIFPGFLSSEQLEAEYENADIFLVPGRQGYGLPVLEALYRGVPVVLNKESRVSEILNANPWVSISENTSKSFSESLLKHIANLRNDYPSPEFLDLLPTETKWASEIGVACEWWKK
jgi:glycosyltransferase involved in cell wall biosynthesis